MRTWDAELATLMRSRFRLTTVPDIPDIALFLAEPASGLGAFLARRGAAAAPYWAHLWAGGLVLARHILDHPDAVRGRSVLDLGTGGGIVAIAAAKAGARVVHAADVDPLALTAAQVNAAEMGVTLAPLRIEAGCKTDLPDVEVLLGGDVFYDAAAATGSLAIAGQLAARGAQVLIGDPGRAFLPDTGLREISRYEVQDFGQGPGAMVAAKVFRLGAA